MLLRGLQQLRLFLPLQDQMSAFFLVIELQQFAFLEVKFDGHQNWKKLNKIKIILQSLDKYPRPRYEFHQGVSIRFLTDGWTENGVQLC